MCAASQSVSARMSGLGYGMAQTIVHAGRLFNIAIGFASSDANDSARGAAVQHRDRVRIAGLTGITCSRCLRRRSGGAQLSVWRCTRMPGYLDYSGRDDVLSGGVKLIPVATPKGTFRVWTKRVGN